MFQVLNSQTEYHFVHRALPHARTKRSVPHTRKLNVDPLVSTHFNKTSSSLITDYHLSFKILKLLKVFVCFSSRGFVEYTT